MEYKIIPIIKTIEVESIPEKISKILDKYARIRLVLEWEPLAIMDSSPSPISSEVKLQFSIKKKKKKKSQVHIKYPDSSTNSNPCFGTYDFVFE